MRDTFFISFCVMTILCAISVVFSRNAVYSAFSLILTIFGLSGVYLLWGSPFMAMIQILIYAGAIVVLFVFVVMLLDLGKGSGPHWHNWLSVSLSAAAVWSLCLVLLRTLNQSELPGILGDNSGMRTISKLLFTDYLWPFEVLSVFLLALMIAIYALARPEESEKGGL